MWVPLRDPPIEVVVDMGFQPYHRCPSTGSDVTQGKVPYVKYVLAQHLSSLVH